MWNAVSDKDKNDSDFTEFLVQTDYQAKQTGFIQPYADSPMDHEQVGEEVYISMVNKAEKYCWFMTPYLIITDEMSHALCLAAKRGVDVRITTPGIPDDLQYHTFLLPWTGKTWSAYLRMDTWFLSCKDECGR